MKKFFCLFTLTFFFTALTTNVFAAKNASKALSSKQLKIKPASAKILQQNPLPKGFEKAEEIYFKQRIDLTGLVPQQGSNKALTPKYFKLKLDSKKTYVLIDLEDLTEKQTKKTSFTWKDFKGTYGYTFYFELVKNPQMYLFIKIEPFAKEGNEVPYAFAAFDDYQSEITFEAMAYGDAPYKGFIKNILRAK